VRRRLPPALQWRDFALPVGGPLAALRREPRREPRTPGTAAGHQAGPRRYARAV